MAWMASSWMSPGDPAPLLLLAGDHPFQQRAALLVEVAQGPVVLGDVAQHDQPADRGALPVGHGHHRGLVAAGRSVPGQHQLLGQPVAARVRVAGRLGGLGQQLGQGPADGIGHREAEEPLGRRVGVDHPVQWVQHQAAPHDHARVDQVRPEQRAGRGHGVRVGGRPRRVPADQVVGGGVGQQQQHHQRVDGQQRQVPPVHQ
jgi:hypothetical protein